MRVIAPKTLLPSDVNSLGVHVYGDLRTGLDDVDVVIHNRGNTRQLVNITARDNDAVLTFSPAATKIPLDPGGQEKIKIHIGMRHDNELHSKPRLPFTITVKPFEGEIKTLSGKVINTSLASNGESQSMGRFDTRLLHIFAELTWGVLSLLLFGWLFLIFDIILTSPQLLIALRRYTNRGQ